jgi:hypothetical protein
MNHYHSFIAAFFFVAGSTVQAFAAETQVLLAQTVENSFFEEAGGVPGPPTTVGMQFVLSLESLSDLHTNVPYGNGTAWKIDEGRLAATVGGDLRLTNGQTGVYDFPVSNGVSFSNVVTALTNGTADFMMAAEFAYSVDRIDVIHGGMQSQDDNLLWNLPSGPGLAGCRIDSFRLIVSALNWGLTNGGYRLFAKTQWQIYGVTAEPCTPRRATAMATLINGAVGTGIITVTDPGCGYTNAPLVLIQGGGGPTIVCSPHMNKGQLQSIFIPDRGCCYTNIPKVFIAPPRPPSVTIKVSKIRVSQSLELGQTYVIESSTDLINWAPTGSQFTATSEIMETEFDVELTGRYFRIHEVP